MNQTIRIIGGTYRGKKIIFPDKATLRPTPDRVRETLFNWLMHDIHGSTCLDAFAGSGALGLEAFSRGASSVTLLEHDPATAAQLKKTAAMFLTPKLDVIRTNAMDFINSTPKTYHIIFLDPPYQSNQLSLCLSAISKNTILAPNGLIYAESAEPLENILAPFEIIKQKKSGHVHYALLKKGTS